MKHITVILAVALTLSLGGCAKQPGATIAPIHAGAANSFDSVTYDALVSAQAAIEQAKVGIAASKKALLNTVIKSYNVAESAYSVYHAAATAGTATPAQQADLQAKLTTLQAGVTQLGAK
jgi:hypothetical protein